MTAFGSYNTLMNPQQRRPAVSRPLPTVAGNYQPPQRAPQPPKTVGTYQPGVGYAIGQGSLTGAAAGGGGAAAATSGGSMIAGGVLGAVGGYLDWQQQEQKNKAINKSLTAANNQNYDNYQTGLANVSQAQLDNQGFLNTQYRQLFNQASDVGTAPEMANLNRSTAAQIGQSRNNAISRGLYNSTVQQNNERGINQDANIQSNQITQQDLQNQMAVRNSYINMMNPTYSQYPAMTNQWIGAATFQQPNVAGLAAASAQPGASGGSGFANGFGNLLSGGGGGGGMNGGAGSFLGGMLG